MFDSLRVSVIAPRLFKIWTVVGIDMNKKNQVYRLKRVYNAMRVKANHRKIIDASESNELVLLNPIAPYGCGGNVEHYYHFVFDLLLPLDVLLKKVPTDTVFVLEEFGSLSGLLRQLFPGRVSIVEASARPSGLKTLDLIGMNPRGVVTRSEQLEAFRESIFSILGIRKKRVCDKVLLIERLPPASYFNDNAKIKKSGAQRRSIVNHNDLRERLDQLVVDPFSFQNVQLEKIPFEQQIDLFSRAKVVIAQHGAGLANCIWMNECSTVVELSHNLSDLKHFKILSILKRHSYYAYKLDRRHAKMNVDDFTSWAQSLDKMSKCLSLED